MPSMFSGGHGSGSSRGSRSSGATITGPTNVAGHSVDAHLAAERERTRSQRNLDARYQQAYDEPPQSSASSSISLLRTSSSASSVAPSFVSYASGIPSIDERPYHGHPYSWNGAAPGSAVGGGDGESDLDTNFDESRWPKADPHNDTFELLRPPDGHEWIIEEMFTDLLRRRELGCALALRFDPRFLAADDAARSKLYRRTSDKRWPTFRATRSGR